jgi:hypothetical protein
MAGHEYRARIHWQRDAAVFTDNRYSRGHSWEFDAGVVVPASSSPYTVRHMLWFLSLAAAGRWRVDDYTDQAVGSMGRNAAGKTAMLSVTLRPNVRFSGERVPARADIMQLHERAHEECFIANSVTTTVHIEPVFDG